MATKTKTKAAIPSDPVAVIRDQLTELQRRREELIERRSLIAASPRSLDEALADIPKLVAATAERAEIPIGWMAGSVSGWSSIATLLAPQTGDATDFPAVPAAGLLCRILPDVVGAWVRQELEKAYENLPNPLSTAERDRQLAQVDRDLAAVDRKLSEIWWSATGNGIELPLVDVSPAALLGLEPEAA
jgi:hypothetical protein